MPKRVQQERQPVERQEEPPVDVPKTERADHGVTDELLDEIDLILEDTDLAVNYRQMGGQ